MNASPSVFTSYLFEYTTQKKSIQKEKELQMSYEGLASFFIVSLCAHPRCLFKHFRMILLCSSRRAFMRTSPKCSHSRVEPCMSVNAKVITPLGASSAVIATSTAGKVAAPPLRLLAELPSASWSCSSLRSTESLLLVREVPRVVLSSRMALEKRRTCPGLRCDLHRASAPRVSDLRASEKAREG